MDEWGAIVVFVWLTLAGAYAAATLATRRLTRRARREQRALEQRALWRDAAGGDHAARFGECATCVARMMQAPAAAMETFEEHDRAVEAAQARAERVLVSHLDGGQARTYKIIGAFEMVGRKGNRYRVTKTGATYVNHLFACISPVGSLPSADVALAMKLLIEANEEEFLRTANIGGHVGLKMGIDGTLRNRGKLVTAATQRALREDL